MKVTNYTIQVIFENIIIKEVEVTWCLNLVAAKKGIQIKPELITSAIKIPNLVDNSIDYDHEIDFPLSKCTGHAFYSKEDGALPSISLKSIYVDYETKSYSLYFENN